MSLSAGGTGDAIGELLQDTWKSLQSAEASTLTAYHAAPLEVQEIVERDDGFITSQPARRYFLTRDEWPEAEQEALTYARGAVLDIGCGAGRVALELQSGGLEVAAIDSSPGAIQVCTERGVRNAQIARREELKSDQKFDTLMLFGNNIGLLGSAAEAPGVLASLRTLLGPGGLLIAGGSDPGQRAGAAHTKYQESNRLAGRAVGESRLRVRYRQWSTDWFGYYMPTKDDVSRFAHDSKQWQILDFLATGKDNLYMSILKAI